MGYSLCSRTYNRLRPRSCNMIFEFITFVVGVALGYVLGELLLRAINGDCKVLSRHGRYWYNIHSNTCGCPSFARCLREWLVGLKLFSHTTNLLFLIFPYRWEKYYFTLPKSRDIINTNLICNQVNHRLYYPNARKVVRNIYALNLGWA